jgi:hypothetical protein
VLNKRKPIPARNPEEIAADAKRYCRDTEKVATTSIKTRARVRPHSGRRPQPRRRLRSDLFRIVARVFETTAFSMPRLRRPLD